MVFFTAKPSLREASCWSFEVIKGGTGLRFRSFVVTSLTTKVCVFASLTMSAALRSEEHTSELQSHRDLHSVPTRRSSDLEVIKGGTGLRFRSFVVTSLTTKVCVFASLTMSAAL